MSTQIDLGPVLSVPKGDWNASTTYERLNLVRHNSASWICNVATSIGVEPTEDSTDWYLQVKDTSSVTSVNGMKGDVVIELTETETPPANDSSNRIATTEWVTGKLGDVDLSGIKDDTVLAAQNAGNLEVGTGELTSAELAEIIENNDNVLRTLIAEEVKKYLPLIGGTMTGTITFNKSGQVMKSPGDDGVLRFDGGSDYNKGAFLSLHGMNHNSDKAGTFQLSCRSSTLSRDLIGFPDGTLKWGNTQVLLPTGAVFAFAANSEPSGCLLCNGAAVSRTTYAALYKAIGTTYGAGDGSTTFNLPNLTDKFIQGSGTSGTVKSAGLPEIYGGFDSTADSSVMFGNAWDAFSLGNPSGSRKVGSTWASDVVHNVTFNASKNNQIYGASTTVQPPAVTMRYYIKY